MGQIGYVLAQALSSAGCPTAPLLCQVVVDSQHEAFRDPSKFVGPIYGAKEATALSQSLGWVMKPDGEVRFDHNVMMCVLFQLKFIPELYILT